MITEVFLWGLLFLIPAVLLVVWLVMRQKYAAALESALYEEKVDEERIINETASNPPNPPMPSVETKPQPKVEELIVQVVIKSATDKRFSGTDIMLLMDNLSLKYGDMRLFHHYGLDETSNQNPVFSVANMLEPGTFDLSQMLEFSTTGLILFMRLPGVLDGRVAFELMLNHAHSIAQQLQGRLENPQGQALDTPQVALLRDKITQYEHKIATL